MAAVAILHRRTALTAMTTECLPADSKATRSHYEYSGTDYLVMNATQLTSTTGGISPLVLPAAVPNYLHCLAVVTAGGHPQSPACLFTGGHADVP
jgi:hypothetical protein